MMQWALMRDVVAVTVADLEWDLGVEYLIAAVAEVRRRGVPLVCELAGNGSERERVLYTAFDLGVERFVRIVEPSAASRTPDIFIWSSLTGRTSPDAEAAAGAGIRVVTAPPRDVDGLADALEAACASS
jgi:hypothetical protein